MRDFWGGVPTGPRGVVPRFSPSVDLWVVQWFAPEGGPLMPKWRVSRTCFILAWKDRWGHLVLPAACRWALSSASVPLCFALIPDPASCRAQHQTVVLPSSGNSLSWG